MAKRRKQPQQTLTLTSLHLSGSLPFDLVVEILYRLPVKHLLQLRCVCKSWNSIISRDSDFAKKQFRLSTSSHDRHHLILSSSKFLLSHSSISSIFTSTFTTATSTVKQFGYGKRSILNKIAYRNSASTCDGILCFKIHDTLALVCNPFIRKFKRLPLLKFPHQFHTSYTLVYDRFTNSYKIIAVTNSYKIIAVNTSRMKYEVSVHTLGTRCWRRILDFPGPDLIPNSGSGTFLNDSVNWLTSGIADWAYLIISLDLEKESYQKLSVPVFDVDFPISMMSTLGTLRGCLSLLSPRDTFYDVLIMKEYGDENSWIKLFSVPQTNPWGDCHYTKVLYISEDDQVLMEFCKGWTETKYSLVVYDSINNTFKIPKFQNNIHGHMVAPEIYVESLICPF
ncbi:F-box/kelch-repeat protein At3g23880-like [Vicia villosa]|uniref:F-box/kelch-repeat protein At3g23880-like n=1 Tax=Vicia villosa TaxID=3911 RepID=UPI00273AAAE0|nr:F-box/kelch-repeat protein At3g23880-like [Vicia villosa]